MPQLILGAAVLFLLLWGMKFLAKTDPRLLARSLKTLGGIGALASAAALAVTGRFAIALPLGAAGLALLGLWNSGGGAFGRRWSKSSGQVSRVRTAFTEMELDHDSGKMRGRILVGPHEGQSLDALDVATLAGLLGGIDDESRALLAAYLDRRDPRWRENAQPGAATGHGASFDSGPMTQEEAYQVLGLKPGASADEIGRAHRSLLKKLHPDQGGSTYLAARVNQAKDVLLRRHQ
jgi:hypothetical protein